MLFVGRKATALGRTLRLAATAAGLALIFSTALPGIALATQPAGGSPESGKTSPASPQAQLEPVRDDSLEPLAAALATLAGALLLLRNLKMEQARRIAWLNAHPSLSSRQIVDLMDDYGFE